MVHKILFWTGFALAARFWQLGIEMRPFFNRESLWVYPIFAGVGGSFGYWLTGVEQRQAQILEGRKILLLEKRERLKKGEIAFQERREAASRAGEQPPQHS